MIKVQEQLATLRDRRNKISSFCSLFSLSDKCFSFLDFQAFFLITHLARHCVEFLLTPSQFSGVDNQALYLVSSNFIW